MQESRLCDLSTRPQSTCATLRPSSTTKIRCYGPNNITLVSGGAAVGNGLLAFCKMLLIAARVYRNDVGFHLVYFHDPLRTMERRRSTRLAYRPTEASSPALEQHWPCICIREYGRYVSDYRPRLRDKSLRARLRSIATRIVQQDTSRLRTGSARCTRTARGWCFLDDTDVQDCCKCNHSVLDIFWRLTSCVRTKASVFV
jgi:hypothetical protein